MNDSQRPSIRATRHASITWTRLAVFTLILAVTFWVHLAEFGSQLMWDSHIFMVIAKQMSYGMLPYRDLWELKPPAIFYYLAGIFTLLPQALWSVRFVDFALHLGAGCVFYALCRREVGPLLALVGTSAWLFVAHHESFNMGGIYTEEYAAIAAIVAVACAAGYAASGRQRWALASGVAVAAAALFKHPGAAALVPSAILISRRPSLRAYVLLLCGATIPPLLVVAYFWSQGALAEFLECNFWALIVHGRYHNGIDQTLLSQRWQDLLKHGQTQLTPVPFLLASLAVGLPFAVLRPSRLRLAALFWVALDFVGLSAQRQYAQHQFILTFPSTCLLGTLAAGWLLEPRSGERRLVTFARAAACAVAIWFAVPAVWNTWQQRLPVVRKNWRLLLSGPSAWPQSPARDQREDLVGRYVRDRTEPEERIHVQGYWASLLGIYWATDRRVGTRYFYEAPYPLDPALVLADLERNRPTYVVVGTHPPFHFVMPWLAAEYTIEAVKWHEYRNDIWVRTERVGFSAGAAAGLSIAPELGGLVLAATAPPDDRPLVNGPPAPRRGQWTSPVVAVRSDDRRVFVDWNPRADFAWNRTGNGLPRAEATIAGTDNEARAVVGAVTKRGYWTVWPRLAPEAVTVRLGLPVLLDRVELIPNDLRFGDPAGCTPPVVQVTNDSNQGLPAFELVEGSWETSMPYGVRTLRLPARVTTGIRVIVTPRSCGGEGGIRRIRARAADMGITVRYRTGAEANLDAQPWRPLQDNDDLLWITGERYVQVQYELWSTQPKLTPVLRMAHVGRRRFELR